MIKDWKIEKFLRLLARGEKIASAARVMGISYSTAMKYKKVRMLPSQLHQLTAQKRSRLFEDRWEREVVPYLNKHPDWSTRELLTHLVSRKPKIYNDSMLRTFQRRIQDWKIKYQETEFDSSSFVHLSGAACVIDFFPLSKRVTLRSQPVPGVLFMFYLPKSKWVYLRPIRQRRLVDIIEAVEDALWSLGFVPGALLNNFKTKQTIQSDFLVRVKPNSFHQFCLHYNMRTSETVAWPPEGNAVNKMIREVFKKRFKDNHKPLNFDTFDQYRNTMISISEELNSDIDPELLDEEKRSSRELPAKGMEVGFSVSGRNNSRP